MALVLIGFMGAGKSTLARQARGGVDADAVLEQAVAVAGLDAERGGELTGDGRLARAHEADQDECHPIRCS